uniref:Uncharacterized protein n=1 Tax=Ixodes ricinus TaxID=34613 RepID=A0A6B0UH72_IXORI
MGRARLREVLGAEFPALLVAPPESHAGPRRCFHVAHVFRTLKRDSKLRLWSVLQRCGRTSCSPLSSHCCLSTDRIARQRCKRCHHYRTLSPPTRDTIYWDPSF